jgi:hypothetical protein
VQTKGGPNQIPQQAQGPSCASPWLRLTPPAPVRLPATPRGPLDAADSRGSFFAMSIVRSCQKGASPAGCDSVRAGISGKQGDWPIAVNISETLVESLAEVSKNSKFSSSANRWASYVFKRRVRFEMVVSAFESHEKNGGEELTSVGTCRLSSRSALLPASAITIWASACFCSSRIHVLAFSNEAYKKVNIAHQCCAMLRTG